MWNTAKGTALLTSSIFSDDVTDNHGGLWMSVSYCRKARGQSEC